MGPSSPLTPACALITGCSPRLDLALLRTSIPAILCLEHSYHPYASNQIPYSIQIRSPPCYSLLVACFFFFASMIFITIYNYLCICLMSDSHLRFLNSLRVGTRSLIFPNVPSAPDMTSKFHN